MEIKHGGLQLKYASKEMRRMIFKFVILSEIRSKKRYTYELVDMLSKHHASKLMGNDKASIKNDIYNIMRSLEKSGYIKLAGKSKSGETKRYYRITPQGLQALIKSKKLMQKYLRELVKIIS